MKDRHFRGISFFLITNAPTNTVASIETRTIDDGNSGITDVGSNVAEIVVAS
jgi:hypothetical protein